MVNRRHNRQFDRGTRDDGRDGTGGGSREDAGTSSSGHGNSAKRLHHLDTPAIGVVLILVMQGAAAALNFTVVDDPEDMMALIVFPSFAAAIFAHEVIGKRAFLGAIATLGGAIVFWVVYVIWLFVRG